MSKKTVTDRNKTPLCIRFRPKDLHSVRLAAAKRGEAATVLIREWVMLRVVAMEEGIAVGTPMLPRLDFKKATERLGEPISVRFRPSDFRRVARQALAEGQAPSPWVRAIAIECAARPAPGAQLQASA